MWSGDVLTVSSFKKKKELRLKKVWCKTIFAYKGLKREDCVRFLGFLYLQSDLWCEWCRAWIGPLPLLPYSFPPLTLRARRIHTLECSYSVNKVKGDPQGSREAPPRAPFQGSMADFYFHTELFSHWVAAITSSKRIISFWSTPLPLVWWHLCLRAPKCFSFNSSLWWGRSKAIFEVMNDASCGAMKPALDTVNH